MKLKFMQQSLKENHLKAGLYVEQTGDDTIALMRVGKAMPVKEFDSRASLQSVVDAADQYLGEITNSVSFGSVE